MGSHCFSLSERLWECCGINMYLSDSVNSVTYDKVESSKASAHALWRHTYLTKCLYVCCDADMVMYWACTVLYPDIIKVSFHPGTLQVTVLCSR